MCPAGAEQEKSDNKQNVTDSTQDRTERWKHGTEDGL